MKKLSYAAYKPTQRITTADCGHHGMYLASCLPYLPKPVDPARRAWTVELICCECGVRLAGQVAAK